MDVNRNALLLIVQETLGMRERLDALYPYALQMPMVAAANVSPAAQAAVERHMVRTRHHLRRLIAAFLAFVHTLRPTTEAVRQARRRYALLKLYFQAALAHFDIFADVLTQRSQHPMGIWLAGLDVAAADALRLPGGYYESPPIVCYIERGYGAAIRRARTRLPGGGESPVAIIRLPRERMIGTGIAASLFHEVGHQASALLDLVSSIKLQIQRRFPAATELPFAWQAWDRFLSEILSDLWSVSRVGIAATVGLISVVSLPRAFVFRFGLDDPHPPPWIRVKLSAALGHTLYPHPQWRVIDAVWERLYPRHRMSAEQRRSFAALETAIPEFVQFLLAHRPASLRGRSLGEVLRLPNRDPDSLLATWRQWYAAPHLMRNASPTLVFAVLGQARSHGLLKPEVELRTIGTLLDAWALNAYPPYSAALRALPAPRRLTALETIAET